MYGSVKAILPDVELIAEPHRLVKELPSSLALHVSASGADDEIAAATVALGALSCQSG